MSGEWKRSVTLAGALIASSGLWLGHQPCSSWWLLHDSRSMSDCNFQSPRPPMEMNHQDLGFLLHTPVVLHLETVPGIYGPRSGQAKGLGTIPGQPSATMTVLTPPLRRICCFMCLRIFQKPPEKPRLLTGVTCSLIPVMAFFPSLPHCLICSSSIGISQDHLPNELLHQNLCLWSASGGTHSQTPSS